MMGKCIYIASILILLCVTAFAQDNLTNKYKTILPDNVWVVQKVCIDNDCQEQDMNGQFYYLNTNPFSEYTYDGIDYTCFSLHNIMVAEDPITGKEVPLVNTCTPTIGIPKDSTLSPYHWSEGYIGPVTFIIYKDSTFSITMPSYDSTMATQYYIATTPPEDVKAIIDRDRQNK